MKTTEAKYVAWLSAESMHNASRNWLSELFFVKDEQLFFDDLVKSYTLQLIDSKHFNKSKKIVAQLVGVQNETNTLLETVKAHARGLEIMVDKKDQLAEEENYKKAHRELEMVLSDFFETYRGLKKLLYKLIKGIIKENKQKRLLQKF